MGLEGASLIAQLDTSNTELMDCVRFSEFLTTGSVNVTKQLFPYIDGQTRLTIIAVGVEWTPV